MSRARDEMVGLGEDSGQVTAAVRVEVLQGLAREVSLALPAGLVVNQVNGATVGDWDAAGGLLRVRLLEPAATEVSFVVHGEVRAPRDGAIAVPLVRVPSAERETGGVAVDVVGAGEIAGRQARGLEPADPSELGDLVAGRESPSMIAFRLRPLGGTEARALTVTVVRYTPQAVLIANVEEARYRALAVRRRPAARRGALRGAQQPAQLPEGRAAAGLDRLERGGRGPADSSRRGRSRRGPAAARKGTRRRRGADLRRRARLPAAASTPGPTRDAPASSCRRSTCPCRAPALELHYSPRFRVEPQPGSFRVESDPGPFAEALRAAGRAPSARQTDDREVARPRADCRRSSIASGTSPAGARSSARCRCTSRFPTFGPSMFLASELTAEASAPSVDLAVKRTRKR